MNMSDLGKTIKQQRAAVPLTLQQLSSMSGVSASHLSRIEAGDRFPSARVLRKIAKPLGFAEDELFTLAGYLSPQVTGVAEKDISYRGGGLDPYVARMLSQETVEVQRAVIGILNVLKSVARGMAKEDSR